MYSLAIIKCFLCVMLLVSSCSSSENLHFQGPNIALNGAVFQSPGKCCSGNTCYGPSLAIDNNTDGHFSHGHCSRTRPTRHVTASWTVKFDRKYYITGMKIYNIFPSNDFKVFAFKDSQKPVIIYDGTSHRQYLKQIQIEIAGNLSFSSLTVAIPLKGNTKTMLTLCEVQIFSAYCPAIHTPVHGTATLFNNTGFPYGNGENIFNSAGMIIKFHCNNGYVINGQEYVKCLPSGNYSSKQPSCNRQTGCMAISKPSNGNAMIYNNSGRTYGINKHPNNTAGTIIQFVCDIGFVLNGPEFIKCLSTGVYNSSAPTYTRAECDKYPKASSNSKITSLSDGNYIGSIILFTCDRGYKMFGSRNITCLNNRQWNTKPPRCDPVKCERPVDFVNGYYTVNTTAPCENSSLENLHYPCEIIAHCNTGYVLRDSKTMYCDDTGVWSLPKPTCDEIQCQYPGPFPHGNYTFFQRYAALIKRVKYGTKISVNCDIGYSYSGPKSRTCGIDGNWSGNAPACTIITCSLPRNITNGNYIFQNLSRVSDVKAIEYGVSVFIKCNNGYRNTGPRYQTCTSNMTWSGGPASCTVIKCEHPEDETVKNVFYILKTGDNFTYGNANISESITVVCRTGFTLSSGSSTRTCLSNGTWSDQDIECSAVTCPIPKQSGDVTNLTSFNKPYNSTIRVLCHRGILRGQAIQRCNEQGKWDGDMPVCETLESEIHTSSNGPVIGAASGTVAVLLLTGLVIALLVYRKRYA
ncbi:CUB and sushi domain-containing protein 3-like [Mercenaria mercenaria]|uniref:CUB and sushi domain-containing protein 3-like n=1 Tax=Mercenaria mercenaria TaxID=6596 RepID=UPI00234FA566|nr:CUB and sushi domain-containing protein 3-like [Mercenaria mercenaria]